MLSSPQTVTYNTVAKDLHKVIDDKTSSVYRNSEGDFEFKVSHQQSGSRTRRMVRLDRSVIAADPLTAVNASQKAGVYIVIDEPRFGFSDAELEDLVDTLKLWLTSANILAVLADRH